MEVKLYLTDDDLQQPDAIAQKAKALRDAAHKAFQPE